MEGCQTSGGQKARYACTTLTKGDHMPKQLMKAPSIRQFYPWAIVLVSCVDEHGKPNIITIGASSICSSDPPSVGIAVGRGQYSLGLITQTGDFGVNIPSADQLQQSDYCGSHSGRTMDKFEAVGFTPAAATLITSPLIDECPVSMECRLTHQVNLGNHDWVTGEIVAVHVADSVLDEDGGLDPASTNPLLSFWGEYWSVGEHLADWHSSGGKP